MSSTWVVVAHRAGARVLAYNGRDEPLELLREIDHPEGRFQNKHIDSDRQGRTVSTTRQGRAVSARSGALSGYQQRVDPHDHRAQVFAKDLCRLLDQGRNEHAYSNVVLVAEPRFLGMLRDGLAGPTLEMVTKTIAKDLCAVPTHSLAKHLDGKLSQHPPPA